MRPSRALAGLLALAVSVGICHGALATRGLEQGLAPVGDASGGGSGSVIGNGSSETGDDSASTAEAEFAFAGVIFLVGGVLSLVTALVVIVLHLLRRSVLHRHPASIVFYVLVADAGLTLKYLVAGIAWYFTDKQESYGWSFHLINDGCFLSSVIGNFFAMASLAWNVVWCVNFMRMARSPLGSTRSSLSGYHAFAWSTATLLTLYLALSKAYGPAGPDVCLVGNDTAYLHVEQALIAIAIFTAVISMTYGVMRLSRGLPESARTRRSTLVFHLLYVVAFIISWGPHLASTFVDVAPHVLLGLDAATYSTQGFTVGLVHLTEPLTRAVLAAMCCGRKASHLSQYYDEGSDRPLLPPPMGSVNESVGDGIYRRIGEAPDYTAGFGAHGAQVYHSNPNDYPTHSESTSVSFTTIIDFASEATGESSSDPRRRGGSTGLSADLNSGIPAKGAAGGRPLPTGPMSSRATATGTPPITSSVFGASDELLMDVFLSLLSGICQYCGSTTASSVGTVASSRYSEAADDVFVDTYQYGDSDWPIELTAYAPELFGRLLHAANLSPQDLRRALKPELLLSGEVAWSMSSAKSGAFFITSSDKRFLVKTMDKDELARLLDLLPDMVAHLEDPLNTRSFLCRIYGCFSFKDRRTREDVVVVVMGNVFGGSSRQWEVYDLKGSTVGRRAYSGKGAVPAVMKDGDFRDRRSTGINIGPRSKKEVMLQLSRDVELLAGHNLMDYSVLLGVSSRQRRADGTFGGDKVKYALGEFVSREADGRVNGHEVYLLGIVDLLQSYNLNKRLERGVKRVRHLDSSPDVSVMAPDAYAERLLKFMRETVLKPDDWMLW